jgi:hypothetical protein
MSAPQATMPLGVVLERRRIDHPWAEVSWRAAAVIPGAPAPPAAAQAGDRVHAATLALALHRKLTEGYRANLSQPEPAVYVVLRGGEAGMPRPFLVTACPYEAQNYDMGGDERVDAVPMPPPVAAFLARFVAAHHVDEPFRKRRRTPHGPNDDKPARKGNVGGPRYG